MFSRINVDSYWDEKSFISRGDRGSSIESGDGLIFICGVLRPRKSIRQNFIGFIEMNGG